MEFPLIVPLIEETTSIPISFAFSAYQTSILYSDTGCKPIIYKDIKLY